MYLAWPEEHFGYAKAEIVLVHSNSLEQCLTESSGIKAGQLLWEEGFVPGKRGRSTVIHTR